MAKKKVAKKQTCSSDNIPLRRSSSGLPSSYPEVLECVKTRICAAQIRASLSVNRELISLYWDIGKIIVRRQGIEGWGRSFVERLSTDVQKEFPGTRGFSPQNLWHMRSLFLAWTSETENLQQAVGEIGGENLPQAVGEIPWGHNLQLLSKLKDPAKRLWYARQTAEHGWSRAGATLPITFGYMSVFIKFWTSRCSQQGFPLSRLCERYKGQLGPSKQR
ncbi:MAG: DUF1016 N-terminal domain-containing protein [Deltaproteobacteria bacterium]|nr:DUF1016 N-terminal domain-containing protein [Deltaproteobacteria bacterium]